jgi:hypothetical protein
MLLSIQMESSLMRPLTDPKTSNIVDYTISEGRSLRTKGMTELCRRFVVLRLKLGK